SVTRDSILRAIGMANFDFQFVVSFVFPTPKAHGGRGAHPRYLFVRLERGPLNICVFRSGLWAANLTFANPTFRLVRLPSF
ncbi:MAG: hypothetical protein ACRD3T_05055, partial [Terriglobia bacterium]